MEREQARHDRSTEPRRRRRREASGHDIVRTADRTHFVSNILSTAFRINATVMGSKNTKDGEADESKEAEVENGDEAVEAPTEE